MNTNPQPSRAALLREAEREKFDAEFVETYSELLAEGEENSQPGDSAAHGHGR